VGAAEGTVRGWLRRFRARAEGWRAVFTRLVAALDPAPAPVTARVPGLADAVEVMGLAAAAWVRRFGPCPPWEFVSAMSRGVLLGPIRAGDRGRAETG
jgi:hypothetical protein